MKFAADKLAFLLSCDWFDRAWYLCGLGSGEYGRRRARAECRLIVDSIVAGVDTYWDADFSLSRGEASEISLVNSLVRSDLLSTDLLICKQYLNGSELMSAGDDAELISTLCALLVSEVGGGEAHCGFPSADVIAAVAAVLMGTDFERGIVEAARQPLTQWDTRLQGLTPDLPLFTVDIARELSRCAEGEAKLIAGLRATLPSAALQELNDWLQRAALDLAGVRLSATIFI